MEFPPDRTEDSHWRVFEFFWRCFNGTIWCRGSTPKLWTALANLWCTQWFQHQTCRNQQDSSQASTYQHWKSYSWHHSDPPHCRKCNQTTTNQDRICQSCSHPTPTSHRDPCCPSQSQSPPADSAWLTGWSSLPGQCSSLHAFERSKYRRSDQCRWVGLISRLPCRNKQRNVWAVRLAWLVVPIWGPRWKFIEALSDAQHYQRASQELKGTSPLYQKTSPI